LVFSTDLILPRISLPAAIRGSLCGQVGIKQRSS
jgi:hypothetical protein